MRPLQGVVPGLRRVAARTRARGFILLAVSIDKTAGPYTDFIQRFQPPFATVRDGGQKLISEVRVPAMPTSYLIDRKGVVRSVHSGFHGEATVKALREEIIRLLEEKS